MTRSLSPVLFLAVLAAVPASLAQEAPATAPTAPEAAPASPALAPPAPELLPALPVLSEEVSPTSTSEPTALLPLETDEVFFRKSPRRAQGLALGVPLAGLGLCAATLGAATIKRTSSGALLPMALLASCVAVPVLGSSAGHLYANDTPRALRSAGTRAAILVASTALGFASGHLLFQGDPYGQVFGLAGGLALGTSVGLGLSVREIIDAPKAARRYNQKHAAPALAPTPHEETTVRAEEPPKEQATTGGATGL